MSPSTLLNKRETNTMAATNAICRRFILSLKPNAAKGFRLIILPKIIAGNAI